MKGKIGAIVFGVIIILTLIIMAACCEKIPAGYCGVVYSMNGGIAEQTLSQGWHMVAPTKKVTLYSIGIEQSYLTAKKEGDSPNDDSFETPSSDGKGLTVDLTFTYRFNEDMVTTTFTKFKGRAGKEVLTSFIKPNIMSWTKEVTAKYPVTDILGDERANLNIALTEYLREKFSAYGIVIESASLIDINPDEETRKAIQKKVNAQQELELANIEKQTATVQANKEKEIALIAAQKEKEVAEIKAEAIRIQAEAEAEANSKIAASLTPEFIEKMRIDKWTGEVPRVSGSGSIITMEGILDD